MERNLEYERNIRKIVEEHPNGTWPRIILAQANKHLLDYIVQRTPLLNDPKYTLATRIYWTLNDIHSFPKCQNEKCGKPLINKNANVIKGYTRPFCNMSCSRGSQQAIEKDKQTRLQRYGNENFRNKEKAIRTNFEKYGAKDIMQTTEGKNRLKNAIKEKYNVDWFTQAKEFQDKAKITWKEKYGVDNPTKSKKVIAEIQERFLKKHGVKSPMQLKEVQDKLKNIFLEKYGVEYTFQSNIVKDKSKQTFLKRYGVEHNMQVNEIRKRRDETCLAKYGTKYPIQTQEVKEKLKKSLKAWYANNTRPFKILYKYDGKKFDSSWELYYYIWLKDNAVDFIFQPSQCIFPYTFQNETHYYHPDFLVDGIPVEIKGDQFFKEDGTMQCPWRHHRWSDEDKAMVDMLYEAKHQCMLKNGVKILKGSDLMHVFDDIDEKYGFDFIEQFKVNKISKVGKTPVK